MQQILAKLKTAYPSLRFREGQQFSWSPETSEIIYWPSAKGAQSRWALLHETGHALLNHLAYRSDFELLKLEVAAWEEARSLATELELAIDEDHIQDCLDTYRDWIYKRSICPNCTTKSIQQGDFVHYRCFNCHTTWRVSSSRFCRAYRSTKKVSQPAVFHLQSELK